ncbi:hypothetical protein Pan97_07320 [Bremerella volcania]|uniref:Uncharacterized protein n=1 Tax=Bremerella volcania TaxID=2527984 RepID=A0A518C3D9_9BACT|nr:hypothetical protein Pan97_07320 [Bremerella volcania]
MVSELESVLNTLGAAVFTQSEAEVGHGKWTKACLDARFNKQDESWVWKIRAIKTDGSTCSIGSSSKITLGLLDVEDLRGTGDQEWYGILVTVQPDQKCDVHFNYDERCASDESLYDT